MVYGNFFILYSPAVSGKGFLKFPDSFQRSVAWNLAQDFDFINDAKPVSLSLIFRLHKAGGLPFHPLRAGARCAGGPRLMTMTTHAVDALTCKLPERARTKLYNLKHRNPAIKNKPCDRENTDFQIGTAAMQRARRNAVACTCGFGWVSPGGSVSLFPALSAPSAENLLDVRILLGFFFQPGVRHAIMADGGLKEVKRSRNGQ